MKKRVKHDARTIPTILGLLVGTLMGISIVKENWVGIIASVFLCILIGICISRSK
ncbi:MAG: hypothetical protein ACI4UU_02020 [Clostridia bacterium]